MSSTKTARAYVALLRGINVGGKNKLPMRDLEAICVAAGCANVRTYIQSGNVVFSTTPETVTRLPAVLARRIQEAFGYEVPVVMRSEAEFRAIVRANPFLAEVPGGEQLHVAFLRDRPTRERVNSLDARRSPPDAFIVRGREIFLHTPNGMARTKLTNAYFDAKLGTVSTVRNWRTVLALADLVATRS